VPKPSPAVTRFLVATHRWLGVALCALFLLWFPSGIGMMYWGMPAVTARDRLERWPTLDPAKVVLSPQEAAEKVGMNPGIAQVRLNSFDGRPAYRIGGQVVYADTGVVQDTAPRVMRNRAAAAWTGQRVSDASVELVTEPDQWIVGSQLRNVRPLWKYSWTNGEQLYIGDSGEVLQYTTTRSRLAAYVSAVPHWLYFTPLRKHQPVWIRVATYSAMIGTAGAVIGLVLAAYLYSPRKKYRYAGTPSRIPYRGQKRWHTILGLVFGIATVTWTFSGSLAFLPFPAPQPPAGQVRPPQQPQGQRVLGERGRGGGGGGLAAALRGRVTLADFAGVHPRDLLAKHAELEIKELELTSFDGEPLYAANLADGTSRIMSLDGRTIESHDQARIIDIVKAAASNAPAVQTRILDQYDRYYLDRTRQRPLPVILALMNDEEHTRYYIDPKTASVVATYSDRNTWRRWLYNGLHSLNFPWLYNYRPLWDIVVIGFMVGGTALCVTAMVLAWRAVGRRLRLVARVPARARRELSVRSVRLQPD
jgi:hypothetical protein